LRVYSYIVDHDMGFAPNPFHGSCTLAACKPRIRKVAEKGDLILGTGSKPNKLDGRLSFWMQVSEVTNFTDYWFAPEFRVKRPVINGSLMQQYGDNIYHRDAVSGAWRQADSFHSGIDGALSARNMVRDTGATEKVLVSRDFAYWGGEGPAIPAEFGDFVHTTQGHRCRFSAERVAALRGWLGALARPEFIGRPVNWPAATG
jgi:hypothetical protein